MFNHFRLRHEIFFGGHAYHDIAFGRDKIGMAISRTQQSGDMKNFG